MPEVYTSLPTKSTARMAATTFELLNSAADHAHLFSKLEFACLIKAISHRNNRSGDVTLSLESFTTAAGGDPRHVRRALASLAARGYLIVLKAGGGRNITNTRRVVLPYVERDPAKQTGAESAPVSTEETRAVLTLNPGSFDTKPGQFATETGADSARGTSLRTANGTSHQQQSGFADADGDEIGERLRQHAVTSLLAEAGITNGKVVTEIITHRQPLQPVELLCIALDAEREKVNSFTGFIVRQIRDGERWGRLKAEFACKLCNWNFITSIDGHIVLDGARWNSTGLMLNGSSIATIQEPISTAIFAVTPGSITKIKERFTLSKGGGAFPPCPDRAKKIR